MCCVAAAAASRSRMLAAAGCICRELVGALLLTSRTSSMAVYAVKGRPISLGCNMQQQQQGTPARQPSATTLRHCFVLAESPGTMCGLLTTAAAPNQNASSWLHN